MSNISIVGIPDTEADKWWPSVSDWCTEALSYGGGLLTLDDLKDAVESRDMQLWLVFDDGKLTAVFITKISVWSKLKSLTTVVIAGNNMDKWIGALDDVLVRFGREKGCSLLDAYGRRGWTKTVRKFGWVDSIVTYTKGI